MLGTFTARDGGATKLGGALGQLTPDPPPDHPMFTKYGESGVATGMGYGFNLAKAVGSTRAPYPGYGLGGKATVQAGGGEAAGWGFGGNAAMHQSSADIQGWSGFDFKRIMSIGMAKVLR